MEEQQPMNATTEDLELTGDHAEQVKGGIGGQGEPVPTETVSLNVKRGQPTARDGFEHQHNETLILI